MITNCRLCGYYALDALFTLGEMAYPGIFPKSPDEVVPRDPISLVKCAKCHLVQLAEEPNLQAMYGENYGYRSGLNFSMVMHLESIAHEVQRFAQVGPDEIVMDIGSNDGTLLSFFPHTATRIGVDPTAEKFRQYYQPTVEIVPRFFHRDLLSRIHGNKARAKVVCSIAMFYDLPDPVGFAKDVAAILADDGAWALEVAYLPEMMRQNAFDGICHEHLEYYGLAQIKRIMNAAGLVIRDVSFNDTNGGSLQVIAMKGGDPFPCARIIEGERAIGLETVDPFKTWHRTILRALVSLKKYLERAKDRGEMVLGYGASTKGNILLQAAGIGRDLLPFIAEVNPDKFLRFTPGTHIPIIDEKNARLMSPDAFLVLPWHFRNGIVKREEEYLTKGGKLIFPLPVLEIVSAHKEVRGKIYETRRPWPLPDGGIDAYELGN